MLKGKIELPSLRYLILTSLYNYRKKYKKIAKKYKKLKNIIKKIDKKEV